MGSLRFWWRALDAEFLLCEVHILTVMRRVFVGGEGVIRGGRSDRSSESGDLVEPLLLEIVLVGGVMRLSSAGSAGVDMMAVVIYVLR